MATDDEFDARGERAGDAQIQRGATTTVTPDFRWSLVVLAVPLIGVLAIALFGPATSALSGADYLVWWTLAVLFVLLYLAMLLGRLVRARARARNGASGGGQAWATTRAVAIDVHDGRVEASRPRRIGPGWISLTKGGVRVYSQMAVAEPVVQIPRAQLRAVRVIHPMIGWAAGPVLVLESTHARVELVLAFGRPSDLAGGSYPKVQAVAATIRG